MEFLASLFKQNLVVKLYQKVLKRHVLHALDFFVAIATQLKLNLARCDLCNNLSQDGEIICHTCTQDIPAFNLPQSANNLLLWPAINKVFHNRKFDQLLCYAPYIWPYNTWLKQFKYQARFELAPLFAQLLTMCWQGHINRLLQHYDTDSICITSVPIHIRKWQSRGFNQAHLIAKLFAKKNNLHYQANILTRIKQGDNQVGQSGVQRRKNLANAFTLTSKLPKHYQHIVLIDDVITTGSTVNEISKLLKKNGIQKITVMTVALSLPKH